MHEVPSMGWITPILNYIFKPIAGAIMKMRLVLTTSNWAHLNDEGHARLRIFGLLRCSDYIYFCITVYTDVYAHRRRSNMYSSLPGIV